MEKLTLADIENLAEEDHSRNQNCGESLKQHTAAAGIDVHNYIPFRYIVVIFTSL